MVDVKKRLLGFVRSIMGSPQDTTDMLVGHGTMASNEDATLCPEVSGEPRTVCISPCLAKSCILGLNLLDLEDNMAEAESILVPSVPASVTDEGLAVLDAWAKLSVKYNGSPAWIAAFLTAYASRIPLAMHAADFFQCKQFLELGLDVYFQHLRESRWKITREILLDNCTAETMQKMSPCLPCMGDRGEVHVPLATYEELVLRADASGLLPKSVSPAMIRASFHRLGLVPVLSCATKDTVMVQDGLLRYLTLTLDPTVLQQYEVNHVTLHACAHDQGWSSFPGDRGTTNNSWTWAEVAVQAVGGARGTEGASTSPPEPHTEHLYTNKHAISAWQDHHKDLRYDSPLVQHLNELADESMVQGDVPPPGVEVQLVLRAAFPGWAHHARSASITVGLLPRWKE